MNFFYFAPMILYLNIHNCYPNRVFALRLEDKPHRGRILPHRFKIFQANCYQLQRKECVICCLLIQTTKKANRSFSCQCSVSALSVCIMLIRVLGYVYNLDLGLGQKRTSNFFVSTFSSLFGWRNEVSLFNWRILYLWNTHCSTTIILKQQFIIWLCFLSVKIASIFLPD